MSDVPSEVPEFKAGAKDVTPWSASVMGVITAILKPLRAMEIDGFKSVWSEGKVVFTRTDKTRTPEVTTTGSGSLPTWLP